MHSIHSFYLQSFRGKTGTAYLFNKVSNIFLGPEDEKEMMTGTHIVSDVYCVSCSTVIGWTYVSRSPPKLNYAAYVMITVILAQSLRGRPEVQRGKVHHWESLHDEEGFHSKVREKRALSKTVSVPILDERRFGQDVLTNGPLDRGVGWLRRRSPAKC